MHTAYFFRVAAVQFNDDAVSHPADSRKDTYTARRNDFTVFGYISSFNDGNVDFSQETVTQVLCQFRQVHIEILCPVRIQ